MFCGLLTVSLYMVTLQATKLQLPCLSDGPKYWRTHGMYCRKESDVWFWQNMHQQGVVEFTSLQTKEFVGSVGLA